ncbi:MAG: PilZ domain-containing protein [Spirochaetales bacterium]|nr:PilZ domain-containing protein [Spirochaetales bacterium]
MKCGKDTFPCILNSSSMVRAQVIAQVTKSFFDKVNHNNKKVTLRLAFHRPDNSNPLCFFIQTKIDGYNPFISKNPNLYFINLSYMQKPPDDLIAILGKLIEAGSTVKKRRHERITITPESLRMLKIQNTQGVLLGEDFKVKCLLRDLSLSGAKVIVAGKSEQFEGKKVVLGILLFEYTGACKIQGTILRCEEMKEHEDFIALGINFDEKNVPAEYNRRIIDYMAKKTVKGGMSRNTGDDNDADAEGKGNVSE